MMMLRFIMCKIFQFHKGAIRTSLSEQEEYLKSYFNSIKVRLEQKKNFLESLLPFSDFNSIKVRLELKCVQPVWILFSHFNSIKVRLEHSCQERTEAASRFQFHKGAIRTPTSTAIRSLTSRFQFHKGAIRTESSSLSLATSGISIP